MYIICRPTTKKQLNGYTGFKGYIKHTPEEIKILNEILKQSFTLNSFHPSLLYDEDLKLSIPNDYYLLASHIHNHHDLLVSRDGEFCVPFEVEGDNGKHIVGFNHPLIPEATYILSYDILNNNEEKALHDAKIIVWYNQLFRRYPWYDASLIDHTKELLEQVKQNGPHGWIKGVITPEEWQQIK